MSDPLHPDIRPRRLRTTPALRRLVSETRLSPAELVLPVFVREDATDPVPIVSMPGVVQHSLASLPAAIDEAASAGIGGVMLFGIPTKKDARGSGGVDPGGILNLATEVAVRAAGGALVVQTDLCLDEFTDHGHCGVLDSRGAVDNDATLEVYREMALAQANAGSGLLGLSGMMDGQVAAVRDALDVAGFPDLAILAYSAKFASAFYGPFRDAVQSSLVGNRRTYQLDPANRREGLREVELDIAEGADIVMVKPAMSYLDVLSDVAAVSSVPVWAYQVSGEYSMIVAAAANGWIDRERTVYETVLGIRRAGADAVLTYFAIELAHLLAAGGPGGMTGNERAFSRAKQSIPGGVNSPVRAFGSVGGTPRFLVSARGPYVTDVEGREYVDLVCSWGPAILGHAHPEVVAAVQAAAARGLSFGASTPGETELAELVRERVTNHGRRDAEPTQAPIEKLRLVSTGTEATMTAIRLARGFTGRDLLVKFAGHYHGHSDGLLAEAGSGVATLAMPGSAGVPAAIAAQTIVIPYNDLDAVREVFDRHPDRIAAVIVEAAAANMGVVAPDRGFNRELAAVARRNGALLILDEVLTGFRVGSAGWWGLEASRVVPDGAGWQPDLVTFGKVVGGGMPLAALGGRADLLDYLAPLGPVYQAGTLSGNPVAVAAGIATLRLADQAVYERLDATADTLSDAVSTALAAEGVEHVVQRAGNLFSIAFAAAPPRDYTQVKAQQGFRYAPFFHSMLDAGVLLPPSVFEAWFVSAAHDTVAVDRILSALPAAAKAAAAAHA